MIDGRSIHSHQNALHPKPHITFANKNGVHRLVIQSPMASCVVCTVCAARLGFLVLLVAATVVTPTLCIRLRDPAPIAHRAHQPVELQRYVAYTGPFDLHQGQITRSLHMMQGVPNSNAASPLRIPELLAIYSVHVDLVTMENGNQSTARAVFEDAYLRRQVLSRPLGRMDRRDTVPAKQNQQEILYQSAFNPESLASRQSILIAGGAESLATPYKFPYPYAFAATGAVHGVDGMFAFEDQWIVEAHIINTKSMSSSTRDLCAECPCTLEDRKANSVINGEAVLEGMCNNQLELENNTACAFETYLGGLHCCVEGEFCLEREALTIQPMKGTVNSSNFDSSSSSSAQKEGSSVATTPPAAPISSFYLRYTVEYASAVNTNRWLYVATCCDATGDLEKLGNLEYDVPACKAAGDIGNATDCAHNLTTYQRVDSGDMGNPMWDPKRINIIPKPLKAGKSNSSSPLSPSTTLDADLDPEREVDLVFAVAHQHHGGLGIRIYRNDTGELLCDSLPQYDTPSSSVHSRFVGMHTCVFDPPQRFRASDILRIEALYNNSEARIGAQSLMYLAIHDVNKKDREQHQNLIDDAELDPERKFRSAEADVLGDLNQLLVLVGFMASTLAACGLLVVVLKQQQARELVKINHISSSGMGRYSTTQTSRSSSSSSNSSSSSDTDTPESPLAISSPC